MPGNSQRRGRRTTPKKGAAAGSGGKGRDSLKGRGRTLPADERPWHKGYSGTEEVPQRTAWKQDKEKRAAAAEGRAPKIGKPGTQGHHLGRRQAATSAQVRRGQPPPGARGAGGKPTRSGPRVAAGRRVDARRRTLPSCWSAATRWSRRCAPGSRRPRSTSRTASRSTSASPRSVRTATRPRHRPARDQPGRAGPDDRWRAAPGHRPAGAAVSRTSRSTTWWPTRWSSRRRCWSRWTASPIRATSARWSGRRPRSARTACSCRSAGPPA